MPQPAPRISVGVAGWSYPHWQESVYSVTRRRYTHALQFHADRFHCIEINSSFYQPIKEEIAKFWMKAVSANPDFRFTAKLHRQFTHDRSLDNSEVETFKAGLLPLHRGKKLGAVLMQFPWAFRFTPENQDFLIRLRRCFREFPLVAEMRHSSWLAGEAQGTLLDYKIGFCNIDQPVYTSAMPPTAILTSGVGYVRLHGRNPQNSLGKFANQNSASRSAQNDYLYSEAELAEWQTRVEKISRFSDATFVIFNNDAQGKSVVNALQMQGLLTGSGNHGSVLPPSIDLKRRFPTAIETWGERRYEQPSLFNPSETSNAA